MSEFRIRHPGAWLGAFISILIIAVLIFGFRVCGDDSAKHSREHPPYPYPIQTFDNQGGQHIASGETYNGYNSNPPTSGPHGPLARLANGKNWGVSPSPIAKENAVHNLEHGGVVIWYNCGAGPAPLGEEACKDLTSQLAALVRLRTDDGMFILLTPYSGMANRIALTAWQNLDLLNDVDEQRVEAFIVSFECKYDPEGFC